MDKEMILEKRIYVTGRVVGYKKEDLKEIVERVGAHWTPFNKDLDLLVIGDNPGSKKLREAKKFGIQTISVVKFFKILRAEKLIPKDEKEEEFRTKLELSKVSKEYSIDFDYKGSEAEFIIEFEDETELDLLLDKAKNF